MRVLVLGGTVFLGRHVVEAALAAGHEVTLFNRGRHGSDLFPEVERLRGDRDGDLGALKGKRWDAVVDTSGYVPRIVRESAQLLADSVDHYTFVSSISVYADDTTIGIDESGTLGTLEDESVEEVTGETYGPLKVLCEREVEEVLPGRSLIIRSGLIVGPHDPTDRFTYWPHRVAEGGEVLAPDEPQRRIQFIDVRDQAAWNIRMAESKGTGIYNCVGPDYSLTMGKLLDACKDASGSDAVFTYVDAQFLLDQGITPWSELPLWVDEREAPNFFTHDCSKAVGAGLTFRPVGDTVRATLEWDRTRPSGVEKRAGLTRERERELLENWKKRG